MDTKEDFDRENEFGKIGERALVILLYQKDTTMYLVDVRNDDFFRKYDVDFLQVCKNGKVNKYEVKTDRKIHRTGNIAFETECRGKVGCLARSIADYLFYYDSVEEKAYVVMLQQMKEKLPSYNLTEVELEGKTKCLLVPIERLRKDNLLWEVEVELVKNASRVTTNQDTRNQ